MTLRDPLAAAAVLLLLVGCAGDPEVVVSTRVGEAEGSRSPPAAAREAITAYQGWLQSMPALSLGDPSDAEAIEEATPRSQAPKKARRGAVGVDEQASPSPPPPPPRPPTTAEEFAATLADLRAMPIADLAIPAHNLALSPPALWPAIRDQLLAPRKARKADYRALLDRIGGDVPNRYGHFERAWKRAHGYDVTLSEDWFGDLLQLPPRKVGRPFEGIYRDCVLQSALLRAAATIVTAEPSLADGIVETLLDTAYIHEGTFRDEVGRAIRAIGDRAIPELLRSSIRPPIDREQDRFEVPYRRAEYAEYQLDALDRLQPQRALAAIAEDPHLLAATLAAYGVRRPADAAEPLLEYVDAEIPRIRQSARDAFLAFVTGPAPTAERKVLRLLGGRTSEAKAGQTYRDAAAAAIRDRLRVEAPELLEDTCSLYLAGGGRDPICAAQPERHTHAYLAHLDARRAAEEEASILAALEHEALSETIAALDRLLVANPIRMADSRVIDAYRRAAEAALVAGEHSRAGQLLRKTAMLLAETDPDGRRVLTVQALLAEAENGTLSREGRAMLLSTAEVLAPEDPSVQAALAALRSEARRPATISTLRLGGGLALLVALLVALALLGTRTGPWILRGAAAQR